jgi:L-alanine-DL-glutamate epimerase-like enolase superfamily enzyme
MEFTVSDVTAHALSSPIDPPQERQFHGGKRRLHKRDAVLVVVEASDGERGFAPAGASSSAMREHFDGTSQRDFAELLNGAVASSLRGATLDLTDHGSLRSHLDVPPSLASQIVGAINVAGYDLVGKRRGTPIYELLNEAADPDPIPLYASAGMYMEPEGYAEQAATLDDLGFRGYKYRPGIGPEDDRETIAVVDDATSASFDVMADAHTWWKLQDAAYARAERDEIVATYEDHDVYWLEEPVAPEDKAGYRQLAADTTLSLAGGESEESVAGLCELADTGAVDFLQGDVRHHAGFAGCWSVVEYCRDRDVTFVPHHFGTLLGLVANAQLVAAAGGELLEYPIFEDDPHLDAESDPGMYPNELAFEILTDDLDVEDGTLEVPDGPGLGVTVDESCIEDYPFVDGAWTTFHYD